MIKRVVVAGCRNYTDYDDARKYIEFCLSDIMDKYEIVIISGGCRGADMLGERFARERNLAIERYCARWDLYGKKAGPKRNKEMAQRCDYAICFWDGKSRGTGLMIKFIRELNKPLRIKRIKT